MIVLKVLAALLVVAAAVVGKWYQMRWIESQKQHKSDIQTLFNGKK